jgi:hypothetical protein
MFDLLAKAFSSAARAAAEMHGDHDEDAADLPLAIDEKGWLSGDGVERYPSPRQNALATRDESGPAPIGVVHHWTATGNGTGRACARAAMKMPGPGSHVGSWHVLICRDGAILQSIPFRRGAWHVGSKSAFGLRDVGPAGHPHWVVGTRPGRDLRGNKALVGIEYECVGELHPIASAGGKMMGWPFGRNGKKGPVVPDSEMVHHRGKYLHRFTDAQEVASRRLLCALVAEYDMRPELLGLGHRDIDPGRKTDPGPWFNDVMLPRILAAVLGER